MCQEKCPVKINTGELIKQLRSDEMAEARRASGLAMVRSCLGSLPLSTSHLTISLTKMFAWLWLLSWMVC